MKSRIAAHDYKLALSGGDLRSKGGSDAVAASVKSRSDFDALFALLFHENRLMAMRAADAAEKLTVSRPEYLKGHEESLWRLLGLATHKELKWHLAQLAGRIKWPREALPAVWDTLQAWASDKKESRIVRVMSLQAMHDLNNAAAGSRAAALDALMAGMEAESVPSFTARIRRLRKPEKRGKSI